MSEEPRDVSADDDLLQRALARELADLGPLMLRQERAEAEDPDAAFAQELRARLTTADAAEPDPTFRRSQRAHLMARERPRRPPHPPGGRRGRVLWAALAAGAVAAVLAIVVIGPPKPRHGAPPVAWTPPALGLADLTRGYPVGPGGGGGGRLAPQQSPLDAFSGPPYTGRLTLSAGRLPVSAATLPAYRLRGPVASAPEVAAMARRLGIHAPVRQAASGSALWLVAADDSPVGLHSLAVSTATGELVYHHAGAPPAPTARAPDRSRVVAVARAWVTGRGWPGTAMPLQSAQPALGDPTMWVIQLGWAGVGPSTTAAGVLWVGPAGQVVEARLWPPVAGSRRIPAATIATAWAALRRGDVPVAMEGPAALAPAGRGTVTRVQVVQALSADAAGALYLVPAYRFSGTGQFDAPQGKAAPAPPASLTATWWAVAPAAR